jgi:hypothetical protein
VACPRIAEDGLGLTNQAATTLPVGSGRTAVTTTRLRRIYRSIAANWVEAMVMSDPMLFCSYVEGLRAQDQTDGAHAPARVANVARHESVVAGARLVVVGELVGGPR